MQTATAISDQDAVAYLTPAELQELDALLKIDLWLPIPPDEETGEPSPQQLAFESHADIIGYGGAAGGGKTDLICGLALTRHIRSIIYRKEAKQLIGITERMSEILGHNRGYNSQMGVWRVPGTKRFIQFGGVKDPNDHKSYQGQPHDFKAFDEVTEMREYQVRFLMGWLRSNIPGLQKQILMTFNPPTTAEGRWVIKYFGPWLDPTHENPAAIGELRWFSTNPVTSEDYELAGPEQFTWVDGAPCYDLKGVKDEDIVTPVSRTFIPAKVEDNPYYMETGYKSVLQAMPEPLRSQMLLGDFTAGIEDDPWQVFPSTWVEMAMERWSRPSQLAPMDVVGVDPSRGGRDVTAISRRHGYWFDEILTYPGEKVPDGPAAAGLALGAARNRAAINVDVIGIGSSVYDHLKLVASRVKGVNVSESTDERDETQQLGFSNVRSMMYWRLREALDPSANTGIALPPDEKLKAELLAHKWKLMQGGKIALDKKDDVKELLNRSPDRSDAVALTFVRPATPTFNRGARAPGLSLA